MFNDKLPEKKINQGGEKLIINELNKEYEQVFNDSNDNKEAVETEAVGAQANSPALRSEKQNFEGKALDINASDIHHMPDKFLRPEKTNEKKKNLFLIVAIILIVLVVIVVGAFAFFVLRGGEPDEDVLDLDDGVIIENEINNSNEIDLTTKQGRDLKRINDVLDIRGALSFYYSDVGKYPYRLSSLTKYLSEIPNNPEPGGEIYFYEVEGDGDSYTLTFVLESGGSFGNLTLEEGKYELSSNFGISAYSSESEPGIEPEPELEPEPEPGLETGLLPIPPIGDDDDDDGLTNIEELLFGTKFGLPDSDFDGYSDGEELVSLYDPLNDGADLVNNIEAVSIYNNDIFNYSVLYPAKWSITEIATDFSETIFYGDEDGDFFKIQVNENPQILTIQKWYSNFSPGSNTNNLKYFENDNVVGVKTKYGFNIYIANEDKVYIISYIIIDTEELNYSKTFEMFSNSFKIIESLIP